MSLKEMGGCLCREIRYTVTAHPVRVTVCHCTFCQKITGSAYLVEPIFRRQDVALSGPPPKIYDHRSDSSGKRVSVTFCSTCGTNIYLEFERFPDVVGLFGGTFDHPNWFERNSAICRHIYTRSAQEGVVLPAGVAIFAEHAQQLDGTSNEASFLAHALLVAGKGS